MRGDVTDAGRRQKLKIELLSQWKLEAESRKKDKKVHLGLGTLPPSDVWKKLRRFEVKTSVSDLKI